MSCYDLWDESKINEGEAKKRAAKRNKKGQHFEKAVRLPHPGQSYNPAPEDHKKLLAAVAKKEVKYLRREKQLRDEFQPKVSATELDHAENTEMVSGIEHLIPKKTPTVGAEGTVGDTSLAAQDNEDSDADFIEDYEEADFDAMLKDTVVQEKRKTTQQRLRQLRDRLQRKQAKLRKIRNIRLNKFNQLKKIKKQLDEQDRLRQLNRRRLTKRRQQRFTQKFERSDPIFCLPSQLPSNLRQVRCPVDAMLRDRMESFQARNLVEPTSIQRRRLRYPRKHFERRDAGNKMSDDLQYGDEKIGSGLDR